MSYTYLLKIPGILDSSTGLAVLASLGIHGLLWAVLPVLPLESKSLESQPQQTVGLVELTPDEQSRLPQSPSEVTLPPFATQPSVLPPLPPPPFQITGLPPLPALPSSFQLLPNNPSISQNSLRTSLSLPKTIRVPPPPPIQNNLSGPSRIAINQPPGSVANRTYYSEETLPKWRRFTPPSISGLPTNRLTPQPFDPNNFPPSPPIGALPSPPPLGQQNTNPSQYINPSQNQKVAANQPAPLTPTSPQRIPERTKRELLARRDQLATNRAARPAASPAPEKTPVREREELETALQQRLRWSRSESPSASQPQPNPAGSESLTTARAIRQLDEYEAQRQKVQEDNPKVETKRPVRQKITTCEKQLDGSVAYINAVVNPRGKIVSGPALYTKTGTVDTQKAVARVRSYPFQATKDTISYDFSVEFKYDTGNCAEPTPEPSPDTQTRQPS